MNVTKFVYTIECYQNGERDDFLRGWKVHAAPGHFHYDEVESLEEAKDSMREIREDFFMRDGGDYDRIWDESGEDAAEAARKEFVESGYVDDDMNYFGIRKFEVMNTDDFTSDEIARILADRANPNREEVVAALDKMGIDFPEVDKSDFADEGEDAIEFAKDEIVGEIDDAIYNRRLFVEVCV